MYLEVHRPMVSLRSGPQRLRPDDILLRLSAFISAAEVEWLRANVSDGHTTQPMAVHEPLVAHLRVVPFSRGVKKHGKAGELSVRPALCK